MRKAVFFDRDGVLNVDTGYLYRIEDFHWIDGAKEALTYLTEKDYLIFVVTNQKQKRPAPSLRMSIIALTLKARRYANTIKKVIGVNQSQE